MVRLNYASTHRRAGPFDPAKPVIDLNVGEVAVELIGLSSSGIRKAVRARP